MIRKVSFRNFKAYRSLEVELEPLTVLGGSCPIHEVRQPGERHRASLWLHKEVGIVPSRAMVGHMGAAGSEEP